MNSISLSASKSPLLCTAGFAFALTLGLAVAQDKPDATPTEKPLNLDVHQIAKELIKEEPKSDVKETLSVAPKKMDDAFNKAEKPGFIPKVTETYVPGAPQRVTKVNGAVTDYCVYTPTVGRTDGIDEIQNGTQNQVRSCPDQAH